MFITVSKHQYLNYTKPQERWILVMKFCHYQTCKGKKNSTNILHFFFLFSFLNKSYFQCAFTIPGIQL